DAAAREERTHDALRRVGGERRGTGARHDDDGRLPGGECGVHGAHRRGGAGERHGRGDGMTEKLDEMMSLDGTVVQVLPGGTFRRFPGSVYEPEFQMGTDDDGQILKVHDAAMIEEIAGQGWTVETGWSGQYSYSGPVMHESEYIGGSLADHI